MLMLQEELASKHITTCRSASKKERVLVGRKDDEGSTSGISVFLSAEGA